MIDNANKKLYMVQINLGGITGPLELVYNAEYDDGNMDPWWDKEGNFSVPGPGYFERDYLIRFASFDRKEVDPFYKGLVALRKVLKNSLLYSED